MNIELSDHDAELFKQFCKYYDEFSKLSENNFFSIKGAAGIVHFDENSEIRKVEVPQIRVYRIARIKLEPGEVTTFPQDLTKNTEAPTLEM